MAYEAAADAKRLQLSIAGLLELDHQRQKNHERTLR